MYRSNTSTTSCISILVESYNLPYNQEVPQHSRVEVRSIPEMKNKSLIRFYRIMIFDVMNSFLPKF